MSRDPVYSALLLGLSGLLAVLTVVAFAVGAEVALLGGLVALAAALLAALTAYAPRAGMALSALSAASAGGYLFARKFAAEASGSLCSVNATFNCDAINNSPASELFGLPVSGIGLAFYLGLAALALLPRRDDWRFFQLSALFSIFTVIYSLTLAGVMVQMKTVCVFCASMYASNLILLLGGMSGLQREGRSLLEQLDGRSFLRDFALLSLLFSVGTAGAVVAWGLRTAQADLPQRGVDPSQLVTLYAKPLGEVAFRGDEPLFGAPDAPYLLLEYADFQCPHCAHAFDHFPTLVQKHPELQIRLRTFPLSGKCNPLIPPENGEEGRCRAGVAARCAHQQGKYLPFATLLYANPGYFEEADLKRMATQIGLESEAFSRCLADPATREALIADARDGMTAGVTGTPTLYFRAPGGEFVQITRGIGAVDLLIEAHSPLPPARPQENP